MGRSGPELGGSTPVKVDPKVFDGYAGRYQLNPNFTISMMRDGDHLYTQGQGQPRFELFPTSDKEYFARVPRVEVVFHTNGQGEATEFVLHQGGRGDYGEADRRGYGRQPEFEDSSD